LDECPPKTRTLWLGKGDIPQKTYPKDLRSLLCIGGKRRDEEAESSASDKCPSVDHWITSSARSIVCGDVRPGACIDLRKTSPP
jgi:hypothetical protein